MDKQHKQVMQYVAGYADDCVEPIVGLYTGDSIWDVLPAVVRDVQAARGGGRPIKVQEYKSDLHITWSFGGGIILTEQGLVSNC